MRVSLPTVPPLSVIAQRLPMIFPEGIEHRNYVVREMAAKAVYVMIYAGAVEGGGRWIRPSQIMDMTDRQAAMLSDEDRLEWIKVSLSQKKDRPQNAWYATNSREPVRDETIRSGFVPCRAVIEREGVATTSSKPRYALDAEFTALFDPDLTGEPLDAAIASWQQSHLSKAAMARVKLVKEGAAIARDAVTVTFPTGEIRTLKPGPSSVIAKAVIEVFAPRFLKHPAVLWLSESGNKVVARDEGLATALGLKIDPSKALPDIILVDLGSDSAATDMIVVFIEVVATDGPIDQKRKAVLTSIALDASFDERQLAFLTAFQDRGSLAFKKGISDLAWGSFAWCASEPDHIIDLRDGLPRKLSELYS